MRRLVLAGSLGLIAGTAGCGSFRDVFTSHADTAARVGSRELKSDQVSAIITRLGGPNPNPQAAAAITGVWVDLQLFAERLAEGKLASDSALIERLIWPQLSQQQVAAFHDTVVARRPPLPPDAADSAYAGNEVRVFQHVLVQPGGATSADTAKATAEAGRLVGQARSGDFDFGKMAARYSADTQNKDDGGFLPASPRGAFVPEFEQAGWALGPGEVSGVVKTQFGFHVIRRPPFAEARDRLAPYVSQRHLFRQDSIYLAELAERNQLEVRSGAAAAIRTAATDLPAAEKSGKVLVNSRGGPFRVRDAARWLTALAPQSLSQIQEAPDSILDTFVKNLAQNNILLREADSAGIGVSPEVRAGLTSQIQSQIEELERVSGLDAPELADTSKTPMSERRRIAAEKVGEYFDRLSNNQAQFRPMPPTLSAALRATGDFKIFQAGVARAIELVDTKRRQDSAAAAAGGGPAGGGAPPPAAPGLQPAPGPPPRP
ncbi:MAG TPA: peptidylprolyl isomerase [Gemmatimonadales bacterium]|nr:peptidylprolyl isomerase [Gemmatimonadales bacterium]